ncbi:MAG TPA: hypothetical protein VGO93_27140 [Candidatus Xenobia bacterium]|jgi:hypothetical protein
MIPPASAASVPPPRTSAEKLLATQRQQKLDVSDLVTNQIPRGFSLLAADAGRLSGPWLKATCIGNTVLSVPAVIYDIKDLRHTLKDKDATRGQKVVNTMILVTDALSGAAAIPLLIGAVANPVVFGAALALTAVGVAGSVVKLVHDIHRDRELKQILKDEDVKPLEKAAAISFPIAEIAAQGCGILACFPVIGPAVRCAFLATQIAGIAAGGASMLWNKYRKHKLAQQASQDANVPPSNHPSGSDQ